MCAHLHGMVGSGAKTLLDLLHQGQPMQQIQQLHIIIALVLLRPGIVS
jgi:hypothetical protein